MDLQEPNSSFGCFGVRTQAAPRPRPMHRWVKVHHSHDDGKSKPQAVVEQPPLWRSHKITALLKGCLMVSRFLAVDPQQQKNLIVGLMEINRHYKIFLEAFLFEHTLGHSGATKLQKFDSFPIIFACSAARSVSPASNCSPVSSASSTSWNIRKVQPGVAVVSSFAYLNGYAQ